MSNVCPFYYMKTILKVITFLEFLFTIITVSELFSKHINKKVGILLHKKQFSLVGAF